MRSGHARRQRPRRGGAAARVALGDQLGARRRRRMRSSFVEPALELAPTQRRRRRPRRGATRRGRCSPPCAATCRPTPAYYDDRPRPRRAGRRRRADRAHPHQPRQPAHRGGRVHRRRSPSSTRRSRPPSWPGRTRSRRSPTTTAARPTSPSAGSIWRSPTCAGRRTSGRASGVEPHPLPAQQPRLRAAPARPAQRGDRAVQRGDPHRRAASATPRASCRRYVGLANALVDDDPTAAAEAARQRRSPPAMRCGCPTPTSPPATSPCRSGDLTQAARVGRAGHRAGPAAPGPPGARRGAAAQRQPRHRGSAALAQQAGRLWHDLGSPIGEARADLALAETCTGRRRDELVAAPSSCSRTPAPGVSSPTPAASSARARRRRSPSPRSAASG